jgi:hypothetical protein
MRGIWNGGLSCGDSDVAPSFPLQACLVPNRNVTRRGSGDASQDRGGEERRPVVARNDDSWWRGTTTRGGEERRGGPRCGRWDPA